MSQEETPSLDDIKICRNEDAEEDEIYVKRLNMRITTWMILYDSLETGENRMKLRDVSIKLAELFRGGKAAISDHGVFYAKFGSSAPYHYFLTTVDEEELTYSQPFSVTFHEIIDYTLGEIVESLHINFMVEELWIATEYMLAAQAPKMTILYGSLLDPDNMYDIPFDIQLVEVEMPEFGCHHSKISILKYSDDNVRIIISSANIYNYDWQYRSQGLWVSPLLPPLPETAEDTDGESATKFKKDFTEYLSTYRQGEVLGWQALIHRTDCSAINVFFVGSVPGNHEGVHLNKWGHKRLAALLSENAVLPYDAQSWPIIAQTSAVGVFGQNYQGWLSSNVVEAMSREKDKKIIFLPKFKFVYPSQNNYEKSYDKKAGMTCLMYDRETHLKQIWIKDYLYQWKADKVNRSSAMPHSKCYTRISPDETEIPWFLLTSSNLSKGAWGKVLRGGKCQYICNYEAGVLLIPQFIINQTTFPIKESNSPDVPVFLLPYDLPLTPYGPDDEPFVIVRSQETVENLEETEKPKETLEPSNLEGDKSDQVILDSKENQKSNEDLLDSEEKEMSDEALEPEDRDYKNDVD